MLRYRSIHSIKRTQNIVFASVFRRNITRISPSISDILTKHNIEITEDDLKHDFKEPLISHLRKRGLIETCVNEEQLRKDVETKSLGLYCGADPTAKSLHLGNLLPLMVLLHFNLRGHRIYPLIGGATGEVGDPSGRSTERSSMRDDIRKDHIERISQQFLNFFINAIKYGKTRNPEINNLQIGSQELKNNKEWWQNMGMLEFLAIYGKHIRVNQMLSRESIKNRLTSEQGIGFNEFTYQILQAYDFYYLNKTFNIDIQVGGNDQYGNIVAGVDLINRMRKVEESKFANEVYGLTVPLLTTSNGVKFGKSAGNAIFIDKELTSSYDVYQFMYNTTDEDIKKFMYKFSLLPTTIIDKIIDLHNTDKKVRLGQRILAIEMCDLIHGDGEGLSNYIISEILFSRNDIRGNFKADDVLDAFAKQNLVKDLSKEQLFSTNIVNILHEVSGGEKSKSEFKRMIKGGSIYIGNTKEGKITDSDYSIKADDLIEDKLLLLKAGKKFYVVKAI
ncbi:tyrosine--tRNA ligase [Pichia kluyveri]|uniref:Tyrosine--tRNA ligase n=1 Tax=Pichia kluyveri TaxID=36015 RepID=A0AAV5R5E8_PICKL|nr:tyrosine--tRNA ligase [Pichia kluyveri]